MIAVRTLIEKVACACAVLVPLACGEGEPDATPDAAGGCQAPADAPALCLTFSPEAITPESEAALDQSGFFRVQVFDEPIPPALDAAASGALYEKTFPADFESGREIALADLPAATVVLTDAPAVIYVRALFFDNSAKAAPKIDWGTWLGGVDLSKGIAGINALTGVELSAERVTTHDVPLVALRRLTATVTTSATPLGDGEGALSVVASRIDALPPAAPTYGYGIVPCVDVTSGPEMVEMFLLGSGNFYVAASFEDLGIETPGGMPPGTMLSLRNVDPKTGAATFDQVTVENDQYAAHVLLDLGFVSPFAGDPSVLGPNSCADLGLPGTPR